MCLVHLIITRVQLTYETWTLQRAEAKRTAWRRAREAGEEMMDIDKEDEPDEKPEPRRRRFPWHDEDSEPAPPPLDRGEYAKLLSDLQAIQDRGRPLVDEYHSLVATDPTMEVSHAGAGGGAMVTVVAVCPAVTVSDNIHVCMCSMLCLCACGSVPVCEGVRVCV